MRDAPILIVDDEPALLESCRMTLEYAGHGAVHVCADSREAMAAVARINPVVVVLDINMPGVTGDLLLDRLQADRPEVAVIMLTGLYDIDTAVDLMKRGAVDFLTKPVEPKRFLAAIQGALTRADLTQERDALARHLLTGGVDHPEAFDAIVTVSRKMRAIFQYIEAVAPTGRAALITGESGAGKELVARAIHAVSGVGGAFVAVNAGGLDDTLFSDTLFGHRKGAFTGADSDRAGLIEQAAGGTLFLDEIGDLPPTAQVKLLRLLQEGEYFPLGADRPRRSDARIVVATHVDLARRVSDRSFRQDLYFRLKTHHIALPPLRERLEDLPALAQHFLDAAARTLGKEPVSASRELLALLSSYPFPGNIRELEGVIFDAESQRNGPRLSLPTYEAILDRARRDLPAELKGMWRERVEPLFTLAETQTLPTLKEAEQGLIDEAMRRADGNQTVAARLLGLSRTALNKRLNKRSDD
ncbi:MAG: sigma-54-dependent Fis family transcriptional regulator [Nitrospinae bacterium]|nr:sigma-54-dependent Fis family transcriptional regulator [Nitrospinota bacterium]